MKKWKSVALPTEAPLVTGVITRGKISFALRSGYCHYRSSDRHSRQVDSEPAGLRWLGDVAMLVAAAIAGGILALMVFRKQMLRTLLNTVRLIRHHRASGLQPHPILDIREPSSIRVPSGLAIAMGTLYCGNTFWRG